MKNLIKIMPIVMALSLVSCKKNQKADVLDLSGTKPAKELPIVAPEEELIKTAQSKPLTNLALSESDFSFGKIKKGDHVEHLYQVTNTGKNPLIISEVKPGCGCTVSDFTKEPILQGQKGKITLKFDSSNFDGVVHKQAEVFANIEKTPIKLTFTADIQP